MRGVGESGTRPLRSSRSAGGAAGEAPGDAEEQQREDQRRDQKCELHPAAAGTAAKVGRRQQENEQPVE